MGQSSLTFKAANLGEERGTGDRFKFVASTPTRDRYGDVVAADWILENYKRNAVVFFNHDPSLVVANTREIGIDKNSRLVADIEFIPRGLSPQADLIHELVARKFMHAVSVGFLPGKQTAMRDDDGRITGFRYTKNELYELSIVGVPANPEALAFAKSLSYYSEESASRVFRASDPALFLSQKRGLIQSLRESAR